MSEPLTALQAWRDEMERYALLSDDAQRAYIARAQRGDRAAAEELIACNWRLVLQIARRYQREGCDLIELVQEGNLGLLHAVGKFDLLRNNRFSTYATWWIRQACRRYALQMRTIAQPEYLVDAHQRVQRVASTIANPYPTRAELIAAGACARDVTHASSYVLPLISLDHPLHPDTTLTLGEIVPDPAAIAPDQWVEQQLGTQMAAALAALSARERLVLLRHLGIAPYGTLQTISDDLGLTREGVRQIEIRARRKLRDHYLRQVNHHVQSHA